jgi:selenocysteine lyase/cysteine desulfurase
MLYVRKEKIPGLWPLQAADAALDANIRKFEEIGTHPAANYLATAEAITFTNAIGLANKAARLVYLRDRWARPLARFDRVKLKRASGPASRTAWRT